MRDLRATGLPERVFNESVSAGLAKTIGKRPDMARTWGDCRAVRRPRPRAGQQKGQPVRDAFRDATSCSGYASLKSQGRRMSKLRWFFGVIRRSRGACKNSGRSFETVRRRLNDAAPLSARPHAACHARAHGRQLHHQPLQQDSRVAARRLERDVCTEDRVNRRREVCCRELLGRRP